MKNVFKILAVIFIIAILEKGVRWCFYINALNAKEADAYGVFNVESMGASNTDDGLLYTVSDRKIVSAPVEFVSSDTIVYTKKIYQYWDFPLLWGDYTCVDYEFHFVNVETGKEEVYRLKPYAQTGAVWGDVYDASYASLGFATNNPTCNECFSCYIVNGEKKLFFRYKYAYYREMKNGNARDGLMDTFGAYVYNFDTKEYEAMYEGVDDQADEFVNMARDVREQMQCISAGLLSNKDFCFYNGLSDEEHAIASYSNSHIHSGVVLQIDASRLPQHNEALYTDFPELVEYIGETEGEKTVSIYCAEGFSDLNMTKMLIEEGCDITYEGITMWEGYSIDGVGHVVSNYDEFVKYWDEDRYIRNRFIYIMWPSEFAKNTVWIKWRFFKFDWNNFRYMNGTENRS